MEMMTFVGVFIPLRCFALVVGTDLDRKGLVEGLAMIVDMVASPWHLRGFPLGGHKYTIVTRWRSGWLTTVFVPPGIEHFVLWDWRPLPARWASTSP